MRKFFGIWTAAMAVILLMASSTLAASITLDVRASSAPNAFGSPSWAGYLANGMASLATGAGDIGDRETDPAAYHILGSTYEPGDVMVTSFPSWRGEAYPAAPFSAERGNRLHFGLAAFGDGVTQFTLADVGYSMTSTDSALDFAGTLAGTTFNGTTRIGVLYGGDGMLGGGDDVLVNSGEGDATLVDALFYIGVGNAYWPGGGPVPPGTEQAEIDSVIAYILQNEIEITGGYTILGNTASVSLTPVPEPSTFALVGLPIFGLAMRNRNRNRRRRR